MNDVLLSISRNRAARRFVQGLGLPLPMPETLERASGPWRRDELAGMDVVLAPRGELATTLLGALEDSAAQVSARAGEGRVDVLIADASSLATVASLTELYDVLHGSIGKLARSGRVIVVGRPASEAPTAEAAAARQALDGFVRSVAKEVGRKGATANLLTVARGAEGRAAGVLRFLASRRSAFVTAQPLHVDVVAKDAPQAPAERSLRDKVVLVTGAARGIGAATARLLADEGARVVCLDRPEDEAATLELARSIGAHVLSTSVTDSAAPDRIVSALVKTHGGLDVVVHNAGITRDRTLAKMSDAEWGAALDVNLGAVVRITDALLEKKVLRDHGRIVLLSSIAGLAGNVGQTNYAASKAGVAGLTRALAPRLAARGITVNAVAPGFVETRLTAAIPLMIREAGRRLSALGQGGQPEDIGHLVTFLAMPASQGLTGQVIRACGGALVGA